MVVKPATLCQFSAWPLTQSTGGCLQLSRPPQSFKRTFKRRVTLPDQRFLPSRLPQGAQSQLTYSIYLKTQPLALFFAPCGVAIPTFCAYMTAGGRPNATSLSKCHRLRLSCSASSSSASPKRAAAPADQTEGSAPQGATAAPVYGQHFWPCILWRTRESCFPQRTHAAAGKHQQFPLLLGIFSGAGR